MNPFIGLSAMTGDVSDTHEYVIFLAISLFPESFDTTIPFTTVSSLFQHRLRSYPPPRHRSTSTVQQNAVQAGSNPSCASSSLVLRSSEFGTAGKCTVAGIFHVPVILVCSGEAEGVPCGLMASGFKCGSVSSVFAWGVWVICYFIGGLCTLL
jgi:hypothetical protein